MTTWLPTLMTKTPEEGYELAVKLARMAIKITQPDASTREKLRPEYAGDFGALIAGRGRACICLDAVVSSVRDRSSRQV
jgi:hypothetical protein